MKLIIKIFIIIIISVLLGCSEKQEMKPDSISYCKKISGKYIQQKCLIDYANTMSTKNESEALIACNLIDESLLKDICLFNFVKKNPSYKKAVFCKVMRDSSLQSKCLRIIERPHLAKLID